MLRTDGRRPDGTTLIPWRAGRHLVWDATLIETFAPSYLQATAMTAGAAAEIADDRKNKKYQDLLNSRHCIPLALETLGQRFSTYVPRPTGELRLGRPIFSWIVSQVDCKWWTLE